MASGAGVGIMAPRGTPKHPRELHTRKWVQEIGILWPGIPELRERGSGAVHKLRVRGEGVSGCQGLGGKLHFNPGSLIHKNGFSQSKALRRSVVLWSWYFKYVHMHVNESLRDNLIMQ